MQPRTPSDPLGDSRDTGGPEGTALEQRMAEPGQLPDSQRRELRIQFERVAQMEAEWDVLRIRLIKS